MKKRPEVKPDQSPLSVIRASTAIPTMFHPKPRRHRPAHVYLNTASRRQKRERPSSTVLDLRRPKRKGRPRVDPRMLR